MVSTKLCYFKLMICLMLLCICIQISHTRATYPDDDDDDQNLFANNYIAFNNGKNPFEEYYYNKKPINHDDVQLAKRIIMLPRVGRRSTNEK